jgi:hypothetical protein
VKGETLQIAGYAALTNLFMSSLFLQADKALVFECVSDGTYLDNHHV